MDSLLMTNITNTISTDPFSLPFSFSSLDPLATPPLPPSTTLLDSFAPPRWPWSYAKLPPPPPPPPSSPAPFLFLTTAQFDALKEVLATPPCTSSFSPMGFSFSDVQTMEENEGLKKCYDEWMENKLAVLKELKEKAGLLLKKAEDGLRLTSFEVAPTPTPDNDEEVPLRYISPPQDLSEPMEFDASSPAFSSSPSSSCSSTLPRTPEANFWEEDISCMTFTFDHPSPTPSNRYITPDLYVMPTVFAQSKKRKAASFDDDSRSFRDDDDDDDNDDNDDDDDEYSPMEIQNPSRFYGKKVQRKRPPPVITDIRPADYSTLSVPRAPKRQKLASSHQPECLTPPSTKRKPAPSRSADPEVVCRINGCRHVAKTRFECYKHRETHFPGRFRCPHPACGKVFVRSSSLSRHLKRPQNDECSRSAGRPEEWGTGLVNFALCSPPWMKAGFLDEI